MRGCVWPEGSQSRHAPLAKLTTNRQTSAMRPISLLSGFLTVGMWTMLSRVLGLVREVLIAATMGASNLSDVFYVALSLPNIFRRFFAEGALNLSFVPLFSKKLENGDDPHGFAQEAFSALGAFLLMFTAVMMIFMPALVYAMASGFAGSEKFDIAVTFGRIAFPYILFISLAALISGVLNANGRFVAAAAAPVALNILLITAMTTAHFAGWNVGLIAIWAVPIAGIIQLAIVWYDARNAGFRLTITPPRLTPELKRLAVIAGPALLAGGVVQINLLVGRQVASQYDGAISMLSYADRLYQLPLGVVGVAIGIVLLPDLSRRLEAGDNAGGRDAFNRAVEFSLALTLPAAVALLVIPEQLISTIYERGKFTADNSAQTAIAVAIYGLGLPAFVLQKALQPMFYAREDTKTPFRYALWSMVVNAVIAVGLMPFIGFQAAALATTLAAWAMVALLWRGSRPMGDVATLDDRLLDRLPRIAAASLIMGALLLAAAWALAPWFAAGGLLRILGLLILVALGIASYFAAADRLGGLPLRELKASMRRK